MFLWFLLSFSVCWFEDYSYRRTLVEENLVAYDLVEYGSIISLNTIEMIGKGHLRSDCFDLVFVFEGNIVDFWLESGCNTKNTTFWIRSNISSSSSRALYMYHGDNSKSSFRGLTWGGHFGFMKESSCDSFQHWDIGEKFPLGGENESTGGTDLHSHGVPDITSSEEFEPVWYLADDLGSTSFVVLNHSHPLTFYDISDESYVPLHKKLSFCYDSSDSFSSLPLNSVLMFDQLISIDGLNNEIDLNSNEYFIRTSSETDAGTIGGSLNHSHSISYTVEDTSGDELKVVIDGVKMSRRQHSHPSCDCTTDLHENLLPYYSLNFQRVEDISKITSYPSNAITFQRCESTLNCEPPPIGWTFYSALDGLFPRGQGIDALIGQENRTIPSVHSHSFECSISSGTESFSGLVSGTRNVSNFDHTHIAWGNTDDSSSSFPEYQRMYFIQRELSEDTKITESILEYHCFGILNTNTSFVCSNGRGECIELDTCECPEGWYGDECEIPSCFGVLGNDTENVCFGHGNCTYLDTCACDENHYYTNCSIPKCYGLEGSARCSSHGTCVDVDTCVCEDDWYYTNCSIPKCYGIEGDERCSAHGICELDHTCTCESDWDTSLALNCSVPFCFGLEGNAGCDDHGICFDVDTCSCESEWNTTLVQNCSIPICFDLEGDEGCSYHGTCYQPDVCICNNGWDTSLVTNCSIPVCFDIDGDEGCSFHGNCYEPDSCACETEWSTSLVSNCSIPVCNFQDGDAGCLFNGTCVAPDTCVCDSNYYGEWCGEVKCFGLNGTERCGNHGSCINVDICSCEIGWDTGLVENCTIPICFGIDGDAGCSYHGSCIAPDNCTCEAEYDTALVSNCSIPICYGKDGNEGCNYRGSCSAPDTCECFDNYFGDECQYTHCFGVSNEFGLECTTHGDCFDYNECLCDENYYGANCNITTCNGVFSNETTGNENACSGHSASCWPYNTCNCEEGYYSDDCSVTTCFGIMNNETENVCSGKGNCFPEDICSCHENYYGEFCNITTCFDAFSNDTENPNLCSSYGDCILFDTCVCHENYYGEKCNITECDGKMSNESRVCNGVGDCWPYDVCTCDSSIETSLDSFCYNLSHPCDGENDVSWGGYCYSSFGFATSSYEIYSIEEKCDTWFSSSKLVSIHSENEMNIVWNYLAYPLGGDLWTGLTKGGSCSNCPCPYYEWTDGSDALWLEENGTVSCDGGDTERCFRIRENGTFFDEPCSMEASNITTYMSYGCKYEIPTCDGIAGNESCNSKGYCIRDELCVCTEGYLGIYCNESFCDGRFGILPSDDSQVCSGHGLCYPYMVCTCDDGYESDFCNVTTCDGVLSTHSDVCGGVGECWPKDVCACKEGYLGENCEFPICQGIPANDSRSCGGGECVSPDHCTCAIGYYLNVSTNASCIPCPVGTYGSEEDARSIDVCRNCTPGYYSDVVGVTSVYNCKACPVGTYQEFYGATLLSDCIKCDAGDVCPKGSAHPMTIDSSNLVDDTQYTEFLYDIFEFHYYWKLMILGALILFSVLVVLLLICCTFCGCRKCCGIHKFDWFFSESHDLDEGEYQVKKKTFIGGVFSVFVLGLALTFISWSSVDFILSNKNTNNAIEYYFGNADFTYNRGNFRFTMFVQGEFDNCSTNFEISGFSKSSSELELKYEEISSVDDTISCRTILDCEDCYISDVNNMEVRFDFDTEYQFVHLFNYSLELPHYDVGDQEYFIVTGRMYEENATIEDVKVEFSMFPTEYIKTSTLNLLLQIINLDESSSSYGLGASIITFTKNIEDSVRGSTFSFTYDMTFSNFLYSIEEYYQQNILNFLSQIIALFSFSVTIMGIFFSQSELIRDFFTKGGRTVKSVGKGGAFVGVKMKDMSESNMDDMNAALMGVYDEDGVRKKDVELEEVEYEDFKNRNKRPKEEDDDKDKSEQERKGRGGGTMKNTASIVANVSLQKKIDKMNRNQTRLIKYIKELKLKTLEQEVQNQRSLKHRARLSRQVVSLKERLSKFEKQGGSGGATLQPQHTKMRNRSKSSVGSLERTQSIPIFIPRRRVFDDDDDKSIEKDSSTSGGITLQIPSSSSEKSSTVKKNAPPKPRRRTFVPVTENDRGRSMLNIPKNNIRSKTPTRFNMRNKRRNKGSLAELERKLGISPSKEEKQSFFDREFFQDDLPTVQKRKKKNGKKLHRKDSSNSKVMNMVLHWEKKEEKNLYPDEEDITFDENDLHLSLEEDSSDEKEENEKENKEEESDDEEEEINFDDDKSENQDESEEGDSDDSEGENNKEKVEKANKKKTS